MVLQFLCDGWLDIGYDSGLGYLWTYQDCPELLTLLTKNFRKDILSRYGEKTTEKKNPASTNYLEKSCASIYHRIKTI